MRQTIIGDLHAGWRIVGHRIEVLCLCDDTDPTPAYRMRNGGKTVPIPLGQRGFIAFDERALPDLAQVREWFPHHHRLWDAVRAQFWDALLPTGTPRSRNPPTNTNHR
ncbi:hypothetical protein [Nocardia australiensis]|uniref:hypothetical protein n=1 Tax=Nocardia australiensis TaxID=2887191 RepID=UPI001D135A65|nr:hypothetical protein [Nocardia australiensis]